MRRESFKEVLEKVAGRMGLDPEATLQANQAQALARYIDTRVRKAWEPYDWPFSQVLEERVYADRWDDLVSADITLGQVVYHLGVYWKALVVAAVDEPAAGSAEWEETQITRKVIPLEQPRQIAISEVLDVWTEDPDTSHSARQVNFRLAPDGILLGSGAPASVWVSFSRRVSRFTGKMWDAGKTYPVGAIVYYPAAGDCFSSITVNAGTPPPTLETSSATWIRQELPYELAMWAEFGAWADALSEDSQDSKAREQERAAVDALADEYDKIELKQKQTKRFRVLSR